MAAGTTPAQIQDRTELNEGTAKGYIAGLRKMEDLHRKYNKEDCHRHREAVLSRAATSKLTKATEARITELARHADLGPLCRPGTQPEEVEPKAKTARKKETPHFMNADIRPLTRFPAMPLWPTAERANAHEPVQLKPRNLLEEDIVITELVTGHKAALTGGKCLAWAGEADSQDNWQENTARRHGWRTLGMDHTIYGQVLRAGANSRYRRDTDADNLLIYGVRAENVILSWEETEQMAEALNLNLVPLVFRGKISDRQELDDFLSLALRQPSHLHGARAGLVIRQTRQLAAAEYHLYSARLKA